MGDKVYPRGRLAIGSGDLIDVTNVKVTTTNNAKQVHTIIQKGAGITLGVEETTLSFDCVISEDGQERDYFALIKSGVISQARIKVPGETMTIEGTYKTRDFELPLDDSIKLSMEFVGHLV